MVEYFMVPQAVLQGLKNGAILIKFTCTTDMTVIVTAMTILTSTLGATLLR